MPIQVMTQQPPLTWPPEGDDGTSILIVQPDPRPLRLELGSGFQYRPQDQERQVDLLRSALSLANPEQGPSARFVLLPEYSLPSSRFADCEKIVDDGLARDSVCIVGFDGMPRAQWIELVNQHATKNQLPLVQHANEKDFTWVNSAVIWVKDAHGNLHRYLQPKLKPAPDEEPAIGMLEGEHVFYFEAGGRSFAVLICFDVMANLPGGTTVARELCNWMSQEKHAGRSRPLTLWVIQNNPRPDYDLMKMAVHDLVCSHPECAVAFINCAQWEEHSGWRSGATRFYMHKLFCPPTTKKTPIDQVPQMYRRVDTGDLLLTTVSLRTGKPSMHALTYRLPAAMPVNGGSPRQLIAPHKLYLVERGKLYETSRVAACQFAVEEDLYLASPRTKDCSLTQCKIVSALLGQSYDRVKEQLENLKLHELHSLLRTLFTALGSVPNPDYWEQAEHGAVVWLVEVLLALVAGGIQVHLAPLSDTELVTAHCGHFTVSVVQGDRRKPPESFYDLVNELGDTGSSHHVLILLEHSATLGATRPVPISPTGEFDGDPIERYSSGEEKMGRVRLYCYSRQELEALILKAADKEGFEKAIKEVFTWQTACA